MNYITLGNIKAAVLEDGEKIVTVQDALDLMMTAALEECIGLIVPKACLAEDFFRLQTRLAGEILQKFVNYNMKIAVIGDFSGFASQSLRDFIYESNKGTQVFFKADIRQGLEAFAASIP